MALHDLAKMAHTSLRKYAARFRGLRHGPAASLGHAVWTWILAKPDMTLCQSLPRRSSKSEPISWPCHPEPIEVHRKVNALLR